MNGISAVIVSCVLSLLMVPSRAQTFKKYEQLLKAAEDKLACCGQEASNLVTALGWEERNPLLKETQAAWERYRDLAAKIEMGDIGRSSDSGKEFYAEVMLRLTNERIEVVQRAFDYKICNASEVRVRNGSTSEFKNVVIGSHTYGDIAPGAVTSYQHWPVAYRYSSVSLVADTMLLKIQPIDYVGERPLGEGYFTYVLTIEHGKLEIAAEEDKKR